MLTSGSTYLVIAQTDVAKGHKGINCLIVDKNSPGITLGPHEDKMGMRSSDTHSVMFNDVKVPKENRIGEDGFGFKFAMKTLEGGQNWYCKSGIGNCLGCFRALSSICQGKKSFWKRTWISSSIAFKLSDMAVKIENARNLCLKAAWLKDQGKPYGTACHGKTIRRRYCDGSYNRSRSNSWWLRICKRISCGKTNA
jgi:alkylation response protein AidB-like acyl-CoA dehydrogenase